MGYPKSLYYTVTPSFFNEKSKLNLKDIRLNILVTNPEDLSPTLFSFLASIEMKFIFSVSTSLLQDGNPSRDLLPKIYLLTILGNYAAEESLIPIFKNSNAPTVAAATGMISEYLFEQGNEQMQFPVFEYPAENNIQTNKWCSFLPVPDGVADLSSLFNEESLYMKTVIFLGRRGNVSTDTIVDFYNQIHTGGGTIFFHTHIFGEYITKEEFEMERQLWIKRTLLYQDFLSLSKKVQEKEYYDVLNWYKQEYEVLPLWYKRFGHIIKVILGKRTFKSLYRDDIKKYKD